MSKSYNTFEVLAINFSSPFNSLPIKLNNDKSSCLVGDKFLPKTLKGL